MLTLNGLTSEMDKLASALMRSPISPTAMGHLHLKFSKCDAEIFAIAIEKLSLGERMPKVGEIFAEYNKAKLSARKANPDFQGCKFCDKGKVPYTRHKENYSGPLSYLGWCRHCNPPFKKEGMFGLFSDRKYPGIVFQCGPANELLEGMIVAKNVAEMVKSFIGTEDPEKEKERKENIKKYETEELPF